MNRKLTAPEIEAAMKAYPPILTPAEAANLLRLEVCTLYRHVSEGRYSGAVRRGKPLRFWRDRLVQEFMHATPTLTGPHRRGPSELDGEKNGEHLENRLESGAATINDPPASNRRT